MTESLLSAVITFGGNFLPRAFKLPTVVVVEPLAVPVLPVGDNCPILLPPIETVRGWPFFFKGLTFLPLAYLLMLLRFSTPKASTELLRMTNSPGVNIAGTVSRLPFPGTEPPLANPRAPPIAVVLIAPKSRAKLLPNLNPPIKAR